MPLERELKFSLAPRAALHAARQLSLPARGAELHSIYFDTRDEALRRARMALRLRREGSQWRQTLKCELSPARRGEWETPAAPKRLQLAHLPHDEIRALTGVHLPSLAKRLRPAFETRFTRRARKVALDACIVELALDRGYIVAGGRREPILEIEFELKQGSMQALLEYAETLVEPLSLKLSFESKAERGYRLAGREAQPPPRKWRAPRTGTDIPAAMSALAAAALEQIGANARGVLETEDAEYLHQLRVGMRRLRSVLSAFKPLVDAEGLRRDLRALSQPLGVARDWDVFVDWLRQAKASPPLLKAAREKRKRARNAARAAIGAPPFQRLVLKALRWSEAAVAVRGPPLEHYARELLERLLARMREQALRMDWQKAEDRHTLRIRVKRFRYACDAFIALYPTRDADPYIASLALLQERLGELNDAAVALELLAELGGDARLARRLQSKERTAISRLRREWRAFAKRPSFWAARR